MNGGERRIEIFTPFGEAFELMKRILFRPFDLKKWLVMGFAAFIAGNWGGGINFGKYNSNAFRRAGHRPPAVHFHWPDLGVWGSVALVVAVILIVVLALVLTWVICRGRFVFTDCVVKNRAAIVDPWHEFRCEGNSFFLFTLAVGFCAIVIVAALMLMVIVLFGIFTQGRPHGSSTISFAIAIACVIFLWLVFVCFFAVITHFMVPVMYRQRCRALNAFIQVSRLLMNHLGAFVLLILFCIVLFLAFMLMSTVVMCATCCLGGLPYVSSVLLLPAFVCLAAFKFYFLRQFGSEYDVWNGASPLEMEAPPPLPPLPSTSA
jgi:hypothetical protein